LNLKEEGIGGVYVPKDELESLKETTKWMAVMRLLTSKPFSAESMRKTLRFAWAQAQDIVFHDLEDNRFTV
jgi:hypothetical protein